MIRYQIAQRIRSLLPYQVQIERPRSKVEQPILVPHLKSQFVNHGHNTLNFEEGELTIYIYGRNDAELIEIGQQLLDKPLSFAGVKIDKKNRLIFASGLEPVGMISFKITINSDIKWEDTDDEQ